MIQNSDLHIEEFFFNSCKDGRYDSVKEILTKYPYLLHHKTKEGWSAIIIASFWQRLKLVDFLIKHGSNPNDVGKNGTSVLMYAKTKMLDCKNPNLSLLELLIDAGAKIEHEDNYGKDIFFYLDNKAKSGKIIINYFNAKKSKKSIL